MEESCLDYHPYDTLVASVIHKVNMRQPCHEKSKYMQ